MLRLSKAIQSVQPSSTLVLNTRAAELKRQGKPVISFAVGELDFPTPEVVVNAAVQSLRNGRTKYGSAGGGADLRKAIASKLATENGLHYSSDQIVVGMGAKEILFHTFASILNPGDEILIPAPYWVSYVDQVLSVGGVPKVIPVSNRFPEEPFSIEALQQAASPRTVAVILNSPNNPSGVVYSEAFLAELGKLLLAYPDWWVISDEIYEYLTFDHKHVSLVTKVPELFPRYVLINGLSKSYSMTGWRVGYGAGPKELMELVRNLQGHSSTCLPPFIEDAALEALKAGPKVMEGVFQILRKRRDFAYAEVQKISKIKISKPQGAFYLFIDIREILASPSSRYSGQTTKQVCEDLLNQYYIALVPGETFGAPGFIRLSYAVSDAELKEGLSRLHKGLMA